MTYRHLKLPASGEKVMIRNGKVLVPDQPIIGIVPETDIFNAFAKFSWTAE